MAVTTSGILPNVMRIEQRLVAMVTFDKHCDGDALASAVNELLLRTYDVSSKAQWWLK